MAQRNQKFGLTFSNGYWFESSWGSSSEKAPHRFKREAPFALGHSASSTQRAVAAQQLSLTHCPLISAQFTGSFCDLPSGASVVTLPVVPSTVTVICGSPIFTSCGARSA